MSEIPYPDEMTPEKIAKFVDWYKKQAEIARAKKGKLHRLWAGSYLVLYQGEVWEVEQYDEGPNIGQWIARQADKFNPDYTDPYKTLRDLKICLGIS